METKEQLITLINALKEKLIKSNKPVEKIIIEYEIQRIYKSLGKVVYDESVTCL